MESKIDPASITAASDSLAAARAVLEAQRATREANAAPQRPSEADLRALDSSIKRNTTLAKKLRGLTEENAAALQDECAKVNQAKYVSEVVSALAEAPFKTSDVPAAVRLCSFLHQRYAEFGGVLGPALTRAFSTKDKPVATAEEERVFTRRRRGCLRLAGEVAVAGVTTAAGAGGVQHLVAMLQELAVIKWAKDHEGFISALTLAAAFAKSPVREALLGLPHVTPPLPVPADTLRTDEADVSVFGPEVAGAVGELRTALLAYEEEASKAWVLPAAERAPLLKMVERLFDVGSSALVEEAAALREIEAENARVVNSRGDLPADAAAEYEKRRKTYEGLHRGVSGLAEALGKALPELPGAGGEDAFTRLANDPTGGIKVGPQGVAGGSTGPGGEEPVYDDQESRVFYESLPDIKGLVPAMLLGLAPTDKAADKEKGEKGDKEGDSEAASSISLTADGTADSGKTGDAPASAPVPGEAAADAAPNKVKSGETAAGGESAAVDVGDTTTAAALADAAAGGEDGEGGPAARMPSQIDIILQKLPTCVSKDLVDELAVNFCFNNSKGARRRLVRALCDVPRAALQLVPFYARFVAVLAQVFPDVPQGVVSYLEDEFATLLARKDATQASLEPRIRNARYLGELCKFKLYPPGSFFVTLKSLLDEFAGLNVDAAATLVEVAGRFLLRTPETRVRMENMLEVMMRLKNVRHLDPRQASAVEGAYYAAKAPKGGMNAARRKKRPPMQEYIRHLIFVQLSSSTIADVLRKLLRMPWAEVEPYVLKCMMKVVRGRFSNIPLIISLAYGLAQYYESLGVALVDGVLESIRAGLENPASGTYQRRMADVKLLGELYNYMLCNSQPVFEALYLLVTFGHEDPALAARVDPADDYFRLRLVLGLLDTSGTYFGEGAARAKLDRFLTFFQAYCLSKVQPLPLDVEFDLADTLHALRPKLMWCTTYEEALAAVQAILAAEAAAGGGGVLGVIGEDDSDDERRETVHEDSESDGDGPDGGSSIGTSPRTSGDGGPEGGGGATDDEFEREYAALTGEVAKPVVSLFGKAKPKAAPAAPAVEGDEGLGEEDEEDEEGEEDGEEDGEEEDGEEGADEEELDAEGEEDGEEEVVPMMTFKLLMKRSGRDDRTRELQVPASAALAAGVAARAAVEAQEREQLKRLVLEAHQAQEDEQAAQHRANLYNQFGTRGGRGYGARGGRTGRTGPEAPSEGDYYSGGRGGQRGGGGGGGGGRGSGGGRGGGKPKDYRGSGVPASLY